MLNSATSLRSLHSKKRKGEKVEERVKEFGLKEDMKCNDMEGGWVKL